MNHHHRHTSRGDSMVELLITASLFALVSGVVVQSTGSSVRRAEVNAIAVELAGWLEKVQRETMSRNELSGQPQPCSITFNSGAELETGAVLARVPGGCAPGSPRQNGDDVFLLPGSRGGRSFNMRLLGGQNPDGPVTYSPRGTTTLTEPRTLVISRNGGGPVRCLRIAPLLGTITIGAANNPDDAICEEESFGGTI
jgi:type II secretory pathway pseudopilin PulG